MTSRALYLNVDSLSVFASDEEPSRFLRTWSGNVVLMGDSLDDDDFIEIGHFLVRYVDVEGAVAEGYSVFDVFDSDSVTADYYDALFNEDNISLFKENLAGLESGTDYGVGTFNVLILDRLIIFPGYRGKGFGLAALAAMINWFRLGAGLIVMKPFPLQFESALRKESRAEEREQLGLSAFSGNQRSATMKLKRLYGELGFKAIRGTDFMMLSQQTPLPRVDDLIRDDNAV